MNIPNIACGGWWSLTQVLNVDYLFLPVYPRSQFSMNWFVIARKSQSGKELCIPLAFRLDKGLSGSWQMNPGTIKWRVSLFLKLMQKTHSSIHCECRQSVNGAWFQSNAPMQL
jgi:hypothetical protein